MAYKQFQVEDLGTITVYKRKHSRNMRLSIRPDGSVRLTIPSWTPYTTGLAFARSRREWIQSHAVPPSLPLAEGQLIGKAHRLHFVASSIPCKISSRVKQTEIIITIPPELQSRHPKVQQAATKAAIRALRAQAEQLLPIRLGELAEKHGFSYSSVSIRHLKTRWGSCDQRRNIILNLFLMQLPWQLIDYVLLHELTHTKVMQHGPKFWQAMEQVMPDIKQVRAIMRTRQPQL